MNERVVEILVYIMTEIRGKKSHPDRLELISRDLIERGYTQLEISSAFSWLFDRFNGDSDEFISTAESTLRNSFRVLSEAEKMILSSEAYGYLLQLRQLQIISDFELEIILEKASMVGGARITEQEVKALVASALFSPEGYNERVLLLYDDSDVIH